MMISIAVMRFFIDHIVLEMPQLESSGDVHKGFRMAEQKEPPWLQRTVEILYDPLFGKLIEIDNDIPTENNIHFPEEEKPVLIIKIEPAEGHKLPYPVGYPVAAILLMKVTALVKRFGNPER